MVSTILVAEDDEAIRTIITKALIRAGYLVRSTPNTDTLWQWIEDGVGDLVISDVVIPGSVNGLDLITKIKDFKSDLPIIIITGNNTLLTTLKAIDRGAYEYLSKPFDLDILVNLVKSALSQVNLKTQDLKPNSASLEKLSVIGQSNIMQELYKIIARVVSTDLTVILTGESGTGKTLMAKILHDFSRRASGPFVSVNLSSLPKEQIESELFGYVETVSDNNKKIVKGKFELASKGTLFLDEIGEMSLESQSILLKSLQEGEYSLIGDRNKNKMDFRIIASTMYDLNKMVEQGSFREDLYYRLNVVPIRIPPLRERMDDLSALVQVFLKKLNEDGLPVKQITSQAIEVLKSHDWPGNIRELENIIKRLSAYTINAVIDDHSVKKELNFSPKGKTDAKNMKNSDTFTNNLNRHLEHYFSAHKNAYPPAGLYLRILREVEKPLITETLRVTGGNQIQAADILGLNRNTLRKKIRDLDIAIIKSKYK